MAQASGPMERNQGPAPTEKGNNLAIKVSGSGGRVASKAPDITFG